MMARTRRQLEQLDGVVRCPECGWSRETPLPAEKWHHICREPIERQAGEPRGLRGGMSRRPPGPGTWLQRIITKSLGQEAIAGCGCKSVLGAMNKLGPDGCRKDIDQLTARLVEVATTKEWTLKEEPGQTVATESIGQPVPQTLRTRWARRFARLVDSLGGVSLIEWQCRRMILLACWLAERNKTQE